MTEGLGFEPEDEWLHLEIGRDPGGNTDWGQYILDAIHAASAGKRFLITSHGQPVARLTPS